MPGAAAPCAAEGRSDAAPEPVINPTGRVLEMSVPIHYGKFYLGDIEVKITPEQEVQAPRAALLAAVKPLLREETFARLGAVPAKGSGPDCYALADLRAAGFDFRFDPGAVGIRFEPTLDQKVRGNISVHALDRRMASPNARQPAELSAFLNLRTAVDYIGESPSGREGLRAPRLDMESAARWQGVVVEAEATYEPDEVSAFGTSGDGLKRRGTRLVKDFEEDAVRASVGDVYPAGTSFQYTPDLLGISLERNYSKLQPGTNIRATSRRSFRIERPSSVDVQVNGLTVRRLRLDAGDYDIGDLPVSVGVNDVTLVIEDDVGNRRQLDFSVFLDGDLLSPDIAEWAFAAGIPAGFDDGEPDYSSADIFLSGFYRRGLTESMTGEVHLQGSRNTVMGGAGVLFGNALGLFSLEGAGSVEADGRLGAAFDGQYALANIEGADGRKHSIRLSAKARHPGLHRRHPRHRRQRGGAPKRA